MRGWIAVVVVVVMGCGPRFLETPAEVDAWIARANYANACVAFRSSDDDLRTYAAKTLAKYDKEQVATDCVCEALVDREAGTWDIAVARGVAGSRRDDLATCLSAGLSASDPDRKLVEALASTGAPAGFDAIAGLLTSSDPEIRAVSVRGLRGSAAHGDLLVSRLQEDASAQVRAEAAVSLGARLDKAIRKELRRAAKADLEPVVRVAALEALQRQDGGKDAEDVICAAMMEDEDPGVRAAAVKAAHGTKRKQLALCLVDRLKTPEDDGGVREAVLESLKKSPRKEAATALCDQIGPHLRRYMHTDPVERVPGSDIIEAQNDRDWDNSYACVQRALSQGGYGCYARNYLGHWFNRLGGKASTPKCPGM